MGRCGYSHFAAHEYGRLQALGFRLEYMPASRYLGASRLAQSAARVLGKDRPVPFAVGLEREGQVLIKAYCPPYYATMGDAVRAVEAAKSRPAGAFRAELTAALA